MAVKSLGHDRVQTPSADPDIANKQEQPPSNVFGWKLIQLLRLSRDLLSVTPRKDFCDWREGFVVSGSGCQFGSVSLILAGKRKE